MLKLIKLELLKHKISSYTFYSIIISVIMLGILYMFAYVPNIESDPELMIFLDYYHLIAMGSALNMFVFCTLSSVIASRFIIEVYLGEQAKLLFSYPIKREKILFAKLLYVYIFTAIAFFISNILVFSLFGVTESYFSLMESSFTIHTFTAVVKTTLIMSVITSMLGIIAMGVGFIKKSVPASILTAVILSSLFCNIVINLNDQKMNAMIFFLFMSFSIFIAIVIIDMVKKKVNSMEV
ncbi:hypothetical protein SAMN04488542_103263 [Fontibacillus panacisegetis]|uniref:ABC-2 family transporter protein n=1 Tax=Fontibacillus panacisegetis TaxID=670482 RepID=A0A1G7GZM5_9BACL|nr:ABC transporter permease [Fontibacillus panacisegetis]SDE93389.1 hypothetical protein SAMN04488542_103263 [Fontibacillus panacisegetis]